MTSLLSAVPTGVQTPRVLTGPLGPAPDADDAIFLASSYGLTPDDWQQLILRRWMTVRPDGRWAASRCGLAVPRQNGKNGIIEMRELFGMVVLGEKFLHTAHEVKTARKAYKRIESFFTNVRRYPELARKVVEIRKTNGQEAIVLDNGGSVEFVARSKGSARGFTVDILVLDEAQELSDEAASALNPTISAAPLGNPQRVYTGTPPGPNMNGEVFARIRKLGITGANERLCWADWGLEGPVPDVYDDDLIAATNPALGWRVDWETILDDRTDMDPEDFAREHYGWWAPDDGTAMVFGYGNWQACAIEPAEPPRQAFVLGVAVSIDRAFSSVGVACSRQDQIRVGANERRPGVEWLGEYLRERQRKYGCPVVIDGKGPGSALIPDLQVAGVNLTIYTTENVLDACAGFYDRVQQKIIAHMRHDELEAAVVGAMKREVGDRWMWGRKRSASDVSMLEAVTLAAHEVAQNDYDPLDSVL